ncbi:hypothetical protein F975_01634 [Acinetobacter sp. ANC 3789]|uniref:hypothetical protein n=1 Tax=Acinetobacter sp. ANC 3789 TaxID=1217714 RepID=UPI0002CF2D15|nr:hypothetical protein [Acinetobacter sp. ANC 3789]ENU80580.1 hypothetical protein F975_01634 [Acinetobacter sp. ANC 3789]
MTTALLIIKVIWDFLVKVFIWIMSNKRWSLIIVLALYGVFQTWQSNSLANDLNSADAKCATKVNQAKDELKQYKADQKEAIETAKTTVATQQQKWAEKLLKVEQDASKKIQDAAAAASALDVANRGLSQQISRANERMSSASSEAIAEYAKTCNLVLEEMATAGGEIAKSADGHEIDTERLEESWDVVASGEKPSN